MMGKEREGTYFMLHNLKIEYNDLVEKYKEIIDYAGRFSESFSLITNLKKPYTKQPPRCDHECLLSPLFPCLIDQKIGRELSGKYKGKAGNHKIMNMYKACKTSRVIVRGMPNLFLFSNNLPEDLCFYRNGEVWFWTITHEEMAFMESANKNDVEFLQMHDIKFVRTPIV